MTGAVRRRRMAYALLVVAALLGAMAVVSASHAKAAPRYTGFSTVAVATPLQIDFYEPTIPIPASPQLELEVGYSKSMADSGGSRGRASLLWPGDPIGEGLKTIVDASGLPKELGENGYPVQANSTFPAGPATESKEPFPGAVMRTSAAANRVESQAGWSGDCDVQDAAPATAPSCSLPGGLAAVADVAGGSAVTRVENRGAQVVATAQAAAGTVRLLSDVLTVSGVASRTVSTSDGRRTVGAGQASYASFALLGQVVRLGPDGAVVAGQTISVPGLPADPDAALAELGIRLTVPKPVHDRQGALLTSTVSALVVDVDTRVLRAKLDAVPWSDLEGAVNALPDQLQQLKNVLGAALYLAPRVVFTLAKSQSAVNTVQGIPLPPLPEIGGVEPPLSAPPAAPGVSPGGTLAPPGQSPPVLPGELGAGPVLAGNAAGLPERFTVPAVLVLGALLASALAATWLRRTSALLLGGAAYCQHGLDTGLPDLRKA